MKPIYIKPCSMWDNGIEIEFLDSNGPLTEDIETSSTDSNSFIVHCFNKSYTVFKSMYDLAFTNEQLLELKPTSSRVRRVDHIPTNNVINGNVPDVNNIPTDLPKIETVKMNDIHFDDSIFKTFKTDSVMDHFLSDLGGVYTGIVAMVNGDPGTMKSSNMLQLCQNIKVNNPDSKVVYVSAEMGAKEAKRSITKFYPEAERVVDFLYLGEYITEKHKRENGKPITCNEALLSLLQAGQDIVVIDSLRILQEIIGEELGLNNTKCERYLLNLFFKHSEYGENNAKKFTTFFLIQQSTKGGSAVGSSRLEYMINGTLRLKNSKKETGLTYMMFEKNRSGKSGNKLYFAPSKDKGIVYNEERYYQELELKEMVTDLYGKKDGDEDHMSVESLAKHISEFGKKNKEKESVPAGVDEEE